MKIIIIIGNRYSIIPKGQKRREEKNHNYHFERAQEWDNIVKSEQ